MAVPANPRCGSKTEQKTGQTGTGTGTQGTRSDGAPTLKKRTDGNNGS